MKFKYYLHILSFIVAILYLISFRNKSKAYKVFSVFLLVNVILGFVSDKLYSWFKIYNHFFINVIFLFQFGFLSLFYSYSFDNKKWRNVVEILLILVVSYLLIKYLIFPESFFVFHYEDIYITVFPLIVYSVMYLYNEYDRPQELYYANLGMLMYLIMNFLNYITWPLYSISIDYTYMNDFNKILNKLLSFIEPFGLVYFSFLLYQLKKLKSK